MHELVSHLDDVRCADLVLGLLTRVDHGEAVAHVEHCAPCAARLRSHVAASVGALATAPQAAPEVATPRESRAPLQLHRLRWSLPVSLAAAASLALVFSLQNGRLGSSPTPSSTRWLATPGEALTLRLAEPTDAHLAAGLAAYARRDLVTAERELSLAHGTELAEQARRLYLAHAVLARGDAARAMALLKSLNYAALPGIVQHDAVGLLVEARRALGDRAGADSLTHALAHTPEWAPVIP